MIGNGSGFFQRRVRSDHLARDQILAYAEMLEGALRLGPPEAVRGDLDGAEGVALDPGLHGGGGASLPPF